MAARQGHCFNRLSKLKHTAYDAICINSITQQLFIIIITIITNIINITIDPKSGRQLIKAYCNVYVPNRTYHYVLLTATL